MAINDKKTQEIGKRAEKRAADYLKKGGYRIVCMNYRRKTGEIDIIAYDGDVLCFVEVKARNRIDFGFPCEAVDHKKRARLIRTADYYIAENCLSDKDCRMDVLELINNGDAIFCRHLKDAFAR